MERDPAARLTPVPDVSAQFPYGMRFDYRDPLLEASLEKRGILFPLWVVSEGKSKATLVSGHKRFSWARQRKLKKVPVQWIEEKFSEKERFLLALYSNWNQNFSELDRMEVVRKAEREFGFSEGELQEEILPALGGFTGRTGLEAYRHAGALVPEIHNLLREERLSFRSVGLLSHFPKEEQTLLARSVLSRLHLTTNQLVLLAGWLRDLKKIRRVSLEELIHEKAVAQALEHPKMDPRTRGDRFFEAVRSLRFPRLTEGEKAFRRLKGQIEQTEEIRLERPEGFEPEGVLLRARLKNREGLSRVIRFLERHRGGFDSFLDQG